VSNKLSLKDLLVLAEDVKMSSTEIEQQRKSFARGLIPFRTNEDQKLKVISFGGLMLLSDLDFNFINQVIELACVDQGVYDLMKLWSEEKKQEKKDNILNDLKKSLIDYEVGT